MKIVSNEQVIYFQQFVSWERPTHSACVTVRDGILVISINRYSSLSLPSSLVARGGGERETEICIPCVHNQGPKQVAAAHLPSNLGAC